MPDSIRLKNDGHRCCSILRVEKLPARSIVGHHIIPSPIRCLLLVLFLAVPLHAREWTDASGRFSIEAELVRIEGQSVLLRKEDGETIRVPVARLSSKDRAFVKKSSSTVDSPESSGVGSAEVLEYRDPSTERIDFGAAITAEGGLCKGLRVTVPVPAAWPEQQVKVVAEESSPAVKGISYRNLAGGSRQMVISVPVLPEGESAEAKVTFEVTRKKIAAKAAENLVLPKRLDREARLFLGNSPKIESDHPDIRKKARELVDPEDPAWKQVEAIYDFVREHVRYEQGLLQGALFALREGRGDCEERTSLFIALCRANRIPARLVWVPGHCYPEFYLQDASGRGHWIPCESAGERSFGSMPRQKVILQKGDGFKLPEYPAPRRYLVETVKGVAAGGRGRPTFRSLHNNITSQHVKTPAE